MKQMTPSITVSLLEREGREVRRMYNVVAEQHAVLVFTPWEFPEKAYPENGGDEVNSHDDCADILESCCEIRA